MTIKEEEISFLTENALSLDSKQIHMGANPALLCIKLPKYAQPQGFRILQLSLSVMADKPALSQLSAIRLAVELSSR